MDEYFLGSDESFALLLRTFFSMSTVDTDKLEAVVASLQNAISILPTGGTSIGEGEMISAGVRQLEFLDSTTMRWQIPKQRIPMSRQMANCLHRNSTSSSNLRNLKRWQMKSTGT